jgi:hypothetical protein
VLTCGDPAESTRTKGGSEFSIKGSKLDDFGARAADEANLGAAIS